MDISPELQSFISELLADGRCATEQEVLETALRRWKDEEAIGDWNEEELKAELDVGLREARSGRFEEFTAADICEEGRRLRDEQRAR